MSWKAVESQPFQHNMTLFVLSKMAPDVFANTYILLKLEHYVGERLFMIIEKYSIICVWETILIILNLIFIFFHFQKSRQISVCDRLCTMRWRQRGRSHWYWDNIKYLIADFWPCSISCVEVEVFIVSVHDISYNKDGSQRGKSSGHMMGRRVRG